MIRKMFFLLCWRGFLRAPLWKLFCDLWRYFLIVDLGCTLTHLLHLTIHVFYFATAHVRKALYLWPNKQFVDEFMTPIPHLHIFLTKYPYLWAFNTTLSSYQKWYWYWYMYAMLLFVFSSLFSFKVIVRVIPANQTRPANLSSVLR